MRSDNRTVDGRVKKFVWNIKVRVCCILLKMFDLSINVPKAKLLFVCFRNMLLNTVRAEGHFQSARDSM
jgi:hypothetical protein